MSTNIGELNIALKFDSKSLLSSMGEVEKATDSSSKGFSAKWAAASAIVQQATTKAFDAVTGSISNFASSVVNTGMKFESSMSEVAAISGATEDELAMLESTAREFGSSTQFSASEAADALKYMSLAGWDANTSVSALGGVLDLAAASGMELGQASDLVTDYLSAFGMEANQSAYFADMLAYAQSNSNTTAEALGEAYKNCAANLNAAGQDIETTTALLSVMADQGLKGSEAGTALNAVMRDMTAKMKDGAIAIGDTKVQVMDANGNYRDMTDILKDVEAATEGMGDAERAAALSATFTADSTKGLNLIMNAGVDKAEAFKEALRGSEGAASEMALTMNDNLEGNLKTLNSNFEELQLKLYDAVQPALNVVVEVMNGLATAANWVMENLDWIMPIVEGLTVAFIAYELAVNGVAMAQGIATTATNVMAGAQAALNAVLNMNPLALILAVLTGITVALISLWNNSEGFRNFLTGFFAQLGEFFGWISTKVGEVGQWFAELWEGLVQGLGAIGEFFGMIFENVWLAISTVVTNIQTAFQNAWNFITGIFGNVAGWFGERFTAVYNNIKGAFNNVVEFFKGIWDTIANLFSSIAENVGNAVKNALGGAINFIIGAIEGAINGVISLINGFISAVNNVTELIGVSLSPIGEVHFGRVQFAQGGIVPGTDYYGDHVPAMMNSGEMVLTRGQQGALWNAIESGNFSGPTMPEPATAGVDSLAMAIARAFADELDDNEGEIDDMRPIEVTNNNYFDNAQDADQIGDIILESMRRATV